MTRLKIAVMFMPITCRLTSFQTLSKLALQALGPKEMAVHGVGTSVSHMAVKRQKWSSSPACLTKMPTMHWDLASCIRNTKRLPACLSGACTPNVQISGL